MKIGLYLGKLEGNVHFYEPDKLSHADHSYNISVILVDIQKIPEKEEINPKTIE